MMPIPGGSLGGYFDNAALMGAFSLKHRRHTLHAAKHIDLAPVAVEVTEYV